MTATPIYGSFLDIASTSIATDVERIETTSYKPGGKAGAAQYIYDAVVDATYVAANPYTAALSSNGRGFRLDPEIMPCATAFGIVLDDSTAPIPTQNSARLQAAFYFGPLSLPKGTIFCDPAIPLFPWKAGVTNTSKIVGQGDLNSLIRFITNDSHNTPCIRAPEGYIDADNILRKPDGSVSPAYGAPGAVLISAGRGVDWSDFTINAGFGKYATAVQFIYIVNSAITRCKIGGAYRGLMVTAFNTTIDTCHFPGLYFVSGRSPEQYAADWQKSYGLYASGHAVVINATGTGWGQSVALAGAGVELLGARLEVAECALRLGAPAFHVDTWNGTDFGGDQAFSGTVDAVTTESNRIGVYVSRATSATISNVTVTGAGATAVPLLRPVLHGVVISDTIDSSVTLRNVAISATTEGAKLLNYGMPILDQVQRGGMQGGNALFSNATPRFAGRFVQSNPATQGSLAADRSSLSADSQTMMIGLTDLDLLNAPVFARNLGGVEAVAAAATFIDVVFPVAVSTGHAGYASIPALVVDGTSTIPSDDYAYCSTLVGKRGETGVSVKPFAAPLDNTGIKRLTVTAGNRVDMGFYSLPNAARYKRRVYRYSVSKGYFEGYWEFSATTTTFSDTGLAFTAKGAPPAATASIPARAEVDNNYSIPSVELSWDARWWISNKTTTGFRINFSSAPGSSTNVTWMMLRV